MQALISKLPSSEIPVLVTSSVVAHDASVRLRDTDERLRLAMESVAEWLKIEPRQPLVLCDGSSFNFTKLVQKAFPKARIECLPFENPQELVRQFGRGYGEGEIVRYALHHSHFISEANCFAKCSSKLWVKNFHECMQWWNGDFLCKGVFLEVFSPLKKTKLHHIDTRFYVASKSFYELHLMDAHQKINVEAGYGLEECFRDVLMQSSIRGVLIPVPPLIQGVGGGTAKYYQNSTRRVLKERLRIALVRSRSEFLPLFADGNHVRFNGNSPDLHCL